VHCHLGSSISSFKPVTPPHVSVPLRARLNIDTGIPIAYPRMVFLESFLSSKLNPLVTLGRSGSLGLKGFVNKFNADAELLDDLVFTCSLPFLSLRADYPLRMTIGRPSTTRSLFSIRRQFSAHEIFPGRAELVHRTTSTICPTTRNPHHVLVW
jgi:hypothetical protein